MKEFRCNKELILKILMYNINLIKQFNASSVGQSDVLKELSVHSNLNNKTNFQALKVILLRHHC